MKPRNPMGIHVHKRKAGAHGKTKKATRRKEKIEFQREYGVNGLALRTFNPHGPSSNLGAPTII